ncbi:hypothetical protein D3C78_1629280 [compost metagenome]
MRLTIKNVETAHIDWASKPHRLDVDIVGVDVEDLLIHIDIITAIKYYGMTELLDTIGEEQLKSHLESL